MKAGQPQNAREQETLQWRFRRIVAKGDLFAVALFREQLHGRLEAIDIQAQGPVQFLQLLEGVFPNKAIIAYHLTDDRSIFLLHKTLIIFHAWASPCERQVFALTIRHYQVIDKLSSIVCVNPKQRKWEETPCALNGRENRFLALIEERKTFGPARCYIGHRQGVDKASGKACPSVHATMGDQIGFHKAGLGLIPLLEGTNGYLPFEQGADSCGGDAMQILYSRSP